MAQLDFRNHSAAQDMIRIIMRDENLTVNEAIEFAINREMHKTILREGYASIALDLWGHDDPEREWDTLEDPIVDIELDKLRERLVEDISEKQNVDTETAVSYFLIFTMDSMGYHI